MKKDPTAFKQRFEAYKNGKPITDIYDSGLPKYDEGSPTLVGEYNVYPSAIGASELNVTTPEIVVTGKDRRPAWKRMYLNPRLGSTSQYYNRDAIRSITDWTPGIGDVSQGFDAYHAAKNGNYGEAAMLGGLLLLPNIIETPLKIAGKTIRKNIKNITPSEWTAAQDAAIAGGDMAEAQRLRDLHFKVNAPTPYISKGVYLPSGSHPTLSQADYYNGSNDLVTLYHSSVDADNLIKEGFDGVEHGLGRTKGEAKGTIFASANQDYAADYSNLYIQEGLSTPDKVGLIELKVPRGAGVYEGNEVRLRPEHIKEITKSAYKKTPWLRWLKTRKTDNSLFNIKSADAVTYNDKGVRIPLGERDNFNVNDIRYGLLPFGLGLTGYNYITKE